MKSIAFESKASQDKFELYSLLKLLQSNPPKRILEVGVDKGYLCETWRRAFPNADVTGIDISDGALVYKDFNFILADTHVTDTRDNLLSSGRVAFDLIFIDGDHSYSGVRRDFEMFGPLIASGGVIAFHDIMRDPENVPHHEGVEVRRFFDEIKQKHASIEIWNGTAGTDGPGIGCIFL